MPFMSSNRPLAALAALMALSAPLSGCDGPTEPAAAIFVGSAGSDVVAASIWDGDQVLVYTCGGDDSLEDATAWLVGERSGDTLEAVAGHFTVVATREGDVVRGTFEHLAGTEPLELAAVTSLEDAGFFVATDGDCRTAAIAYRRAGIMTVQGAHFCSADGPFFQVTPVLPNELLGATLRVQFTDESGLRELNLERREGI
jgi:hypothetical protein